MFVIEMRKLVGDMWGNWSGVWSSEDGADTAKYLKQLCSERRVGCEYRMTFKIS